MMRITKLLVTGMLLFCGRWRCICKVGSVPCVAFQLASSSARELCVVCGASCVPIRQLMFIIFKFQITVCVPNPGASSLILMKVPCSLCEQEVFIASLRLCLSRGGHFGQVNGLFSYEPFLLWLYDFHVYV